MVALIVPVLTVFLALATLAEAQYRYRTVDAPCPGCTRTIVTGITPDGTIVGTYFDAAFHPHGFHWPKRGDFTPLLFVRPHAVNRLGVITGDFNNRSAFSGFVYHEGTLHVLDVRQPPHFDFAVTTRAFDINDAGQVVGYFIPPGDTSQHGFLYDPATSAYTVIDVPGALQTLFRALDNHGRLLGVAEVSMGVNRGFLWEQGVITFLELPNQQHAVWVGLTDTGLLAGNGGPGPFVFDGTTVEKVRVPDAQDARLEGINHDGTVYGWYSDASGAVHGFVATPVGAKPAPNRPAQSQGR